MTQTCMPTWLGLGAGPGPSQYEQPSTWVRCAARTLVNERTARNLGGKEPFLAKRARKVVSVSGIPCYRPNWSGGFEAWRNDVLEPNARHLIYRLLDAGDVRQLAELAIPGGTTIDDAPQSLIPWAAYAAAERVTNEPLAVSLTLTVAPEKDTFTLWVGYV